MQAGQNAGIHSGPQLREKNMSGLGLDTWTILDLMSMKARRLQSAKGAGRTVVEDVGDSKWLKDGRVNIIQGSIVGKLEKIPA